MEPEILEPLVECPICLERLNKSNRFLPCQHTFCKTCLGAVIDKFGELRCPVCRTVCNTSIDDLQCSIMVMRILGMIEQFEKESHQPSKGFIKNGEKSVFRFCAPRLPEIPSLGVSEGTKTTNSDSELDNLVFSFRKAFKEVSITPTKCDSTDSNVPAQQSKKQVNWNFLSNRETIEGASFKGHENLRDNPAHVSPFEENKNSTSSSKTFDLNVQSSLFRETHSPSVLEAIRINEARKECSSPFASTWDVTMKSFTPESSSSSASVCYNNNKNQFSISRGNQCGTRNNERSGKKSFGFRHRSSENSKYSITSPSKETIVHADRDNDVSMVCTNFPSLNSSQLKSSVDNANMIDVKPSIMTTPEHLKSANIVPRNIFTFTAFKPDLTVATRSTTEIPSPTSHSTSKAESPTLSNSGETTHVDQETGRSDFSANSYTFNVNLK